MDDNAVLRQCAREVAAYPSEMPASLAQLHMEDHRLIVETLKEALNK